MCCAQSNRGKAMSQHVEKIRVLLDQGSALHQLGKLEEAKLIYEAILKINIKQFEANHLLGTLLAQMGQYSSAIEFLNKAILINPNLHETYSNLGNAYLESNQFGKAIKTYDKSIKLKPTNAKDYSNRGIAFHNLRKFTDALKNFDKAIELKIDYENTYLNKANTLIEIGEIDKAIACYEKCIQINLNYPEAYLNLALAKMRLKKYEDAIIILDRALEVKPIFSDAFMNKGIALIEIGKLEMAFECFQKAIELEPQSPAIYCNLGVAQTSLGNLNEAIQSFNKAIEFKSDFADAFSGRAIAQINQGEFDKAVESYKIAIEINPNNASYYLNVGNALAELRRFEECVASYDKAIELKTDYAPAYANRGHILLTYLNDPAGALVFFEVALGLQPDFTEAYINQGQAFSNLDQIEKSINSFLKALEINPDSPFVIGKCLHHKMKICDWDNLTEGISICESLFYKNIPAAVPFEALILFDNPEIHLISAKLTNDLKFKNLVPVGSFPKRARKEKIRIGYYSADLYYHPVSIWLAEQIENHDKNKFELFAFSMKSVVDPMRTRLENAFDHWLDIESMSDVQVTQLSRDLEIDIAIDLNGHTAHSRPGIFAARAAPIQINHLGFPGTMGVDYIDYYISDEFFVTENIKKHFTEKIAYVPCPYTYDRRRQISKDSLNRQQFGLPEDVFVFTCQNSYQKIMPDVFDIWMQILTAVPNSVLWLADQNQLGKDNLLKEAELRGVDRNRLIFCKRDLVLKELEQIRIGQYLASYQLADLFLDTWPYNAGTTAVDALWAGLPVLTKAGVSSGARMATSALHAIEMPELIASNQEEYKNLAIKFANDDKYLKLIKNKLQHNILTTKLFDPVGNTKDIEKAYIEMFSRYRAGQNPEDIYIKN
jgi:protein O-GlcNAc transferase